MTLVFDMLGLKCPLPVLKTNRRLRHLGKGVMVTILSDDPKAADDFRHYCDQRGHDLISCEEKGPVIRVTLRTRGAAGDASKSGESGPAGDVSKSGGPGPAGDVSKSGGPGPSGDASKSGRPDPAGDVSKSGGPGPAGGRR